MRRPPPPSSPLALPLALLLSGCGASGPLGGVHPEFAETVARTPTTHKTALFLAADGRIRALSVYHQDATAIPQPVRALGEKHFAGRAVKYYETEWYPDAGMVFEVEYALDGGRSGELSAKADGTLVYVEEPVTAPPPEIVQAALAAVGGGEVGEVERQRGPGLDHFGVKVRHADRLHVLLIKPDGRVVRHSLRVPAQLDVPLPGK